MELSEFMKSLTFSIEGLKILTSSSYKQVGLAGFHTIIPLQPLDNIEAASLFIAKIPI